VVEFGSKFENTEEEEQQLELPTSPESYMMTGALPVATRPERYHNTRSKNAYVGNPDFQAESKEDSSFGTGLESKSKVASKKTAASSLPLSGLFDCNRYKELVDNHFVCGWATGKRC
jgi:hypothetical protein